MEKSFFYFDSCHKNMLLESLNIPLPSQRNLDEQKYMSFAKFRQSYRNLTPATLSFIWQKPMCHFFNPSSCAYNVYIFCSLNLIYQHDIFFFHLLFLCCCTMSFLFLYCYRNSCFLIHATCHECVCRQNRGLTSHI